MILSLRPTPRTIGPGCRIVARVLVAWMLSAAAPACAQPAVHPLPIVGETLDPISQYNAAVPQREYEEYDAAKGSDWSSQLLPDGLIYRSYLAGTKEPRISGVWSSEKTFGATWDITLGGRAAIWRYGTCGPRPDGFELDIEGAAEPRLDPDGVSTPLIATDYRFGIPFTYGNGPWRTKIGYYHVSSHLGDEFMLMNPSATRINYVRDSFIAGLSYYWTDNLRFYGEFGYAAISGGAEPVEFQFGSEYAPAESTGARGAPFAAINANLREEVDYGGNLCVQAGWAWRNGVNGHMIRVGMQYFVGKDDEYEFFNNHVEKIGGGIWYDF